MLPLIDHILATLSFLFCACHALFHLRVSMLLFSILNSDPRTSHDRLTHCPIFSATPKKKDFFIWLPATSLH